ncbi:MAG: hypothetical protein M3245_05200, partial [Actinomycetota bacterium]|nr:hypothetical protein [Actinomycetota bacterium]
VLPGFEGIHELDVSNPQAPALLGMVPLACGSHPATGVPDPANNRLLVYNGASDGTCPYFEIIEVPLTGTMIPKIVGLAPTGRGCHDISVIFGTTMMVNCAGGSGFTAFSIGGSRGGSLTSPQQLYTKSITGVTIGHSTSFSWDGKVLIFGHEPGGGSAPRCQASSPAHEKSLFFFDSATGNELGRWMLPRPQTAAENCTIHNFNIVPQTDRNILVSGNYQSGIAVVDFTDPANAVEIAHADPSALSPLRLGGDWSSYWYDGYIYQSDITQGLYVWELDDEAVEGAQSLGRLNPQTQENTLS